MLLTANGFRVIGAEIILPLTGAWQADLSVDSDQESSLNGGIELELVDGDVRINLSGFARRARTYLGRVGVRMVAGKGGLPTILDPAHYKGVTAGIPAKDIADGAGEELDPDSTLDTEFAHWTRLRAPAGIQLADLARELELPCWRVTLAGKLLIKAFEWPDSGVKELEILDRNPADGTLTLGRFVQPGTTILGEKVTRAIMAIGDDGLRTKVWIGDVGDQ